MNATRLIGIGSIVCMRMLVITGIFKPIQLSIPDYSQNPQWYRDESTRKNKEQAEHFKKKQLLDTQAIGFYVKNSTQYPARVRVRVFPLDQIIEKNILPGSVVELLGNAPSIDHRYEFSATIFLTQQRGLLIAPLLTFSSNGHLPSNAITSSKIWSSTDHKGQKIELVLKLIEKSGSKPFLEIETVKN